MATSPYSPYRVVNIIAKYNHLLELNPHFKENIVSVWMRRLSDIDHEIVNKYINALSNHKVLTKEHLTHQVSYKPPTIY